jgi:hypothetical protein
VLTGSSTVIASSNALPDEPLYPVKLATEDMRLAFAVSDTQKAQVHTQLAETRAVEVETMADQGKTEHAAITAARLAKQLELANSAIAKVETASGTAPPSTTTPEPAVTEPAPLAPPTPSETVTEEQPSPPEAQPTPPTATTQDKGVTAKTEHFKKSLEKSTSKSLTALENALEKAPPQAKPNLQRAIDTISEKSREKQSYENGTRDWGDWNKDKDKEGGKTWGENKGEKDKPTPVQPEPKPALVPQT